MLAASTDADEERRMLPRVERTAQTEMHRAAAAGKASGIEQFARKRAAHLQRKTKRPH